MGSSLLWLDSEQVHDLEQEYPNFLSLWGPLAFRHSVVGAGTKWLPQEVEPAAKCLPQFTFSLMVKTLVLRCPLLPKQQF